jgi:hypothetical protein
VGDYVNNIKTTARFAGLFSLLTIVAGGFAQGYASGRLIHFGDAAATAANMRAHSGLLYLGFAIFMIEMACQIVATALFFELLRPVNRSVNLAAALLSLAGCIIKAFSRVFFLAPLLVPNDPALSLLLLGINDRGAAMALLFFGFSTPLKGYLMYRSTFLPRIVGILGMVSGAGWLLFLYPPMGYAWFNVIAAVGLIASVVLIFWLLVYGVDETRWRERIRQAQAHLI